MKVANFAGRNLNMYEIIYGLTDREGNNRVWVCGDYGIGKTATCTMVCHYLKERRVFSKMLYVPIEGATNLLRVVCDAIRERFTTSSQRTYLDNFKTVHESLGDNGLLILDTNMNTINNIQRLLYFTDKLLQ